MGGIPFGPAAGRGGTSSLIGGSAARFVKAMGLKPVEPSIYIRPCQDLFHIFTGFREWNILDELLPGHHSEIFQPAVYVS